MAGAEFLAISSSGIVRLQGAQEVQAPPDHHKGDDQPLEDERVETEQEPAAERSGEQRGSEVRGGARGQLVLFVRSQDRCVHAHRLAQPSPTCYTFSVRQMIRVQDYRVVIGPLSEEDGGGFLATVPELPGCMSDGETPQEALDNVYDAIACWIEGCSEAGQPVPEPERAAF